MSRRSRLIRLIRIHPGASREILRVRCVPVGSVAGSAGPGDTARSVEPETSSRRPVIFLSELDYVSRCILDYPDIETGGQLFGYWTDEGVPVVMYAIGPGRNANHQVTFFNQDVSYLINVGNELRNRYGLHHIGEWHSHHKLGLARPSGHDANTMVSTIREKRLGQFLLCIGNTDGVTTSFNPFMCDDRECSPVAWEVIKADSPVRADADANMSGLIHPRTAAASHSDRRFVRNTSSVRFPSGYWLNDKHGRELFNSLVSHYKVSGAASTVVMPKVDESGLAHIIRDGVDGTRKIRVDMLFPQCFPEDSPRIAVFVDGVKQQERYPVRWEYNRYSLFEAVIRYETTSLLQYR